MVVPFSSSVEAIPITDDTLCRDGKELRVCKEKSPINARLQILESSFDQLPYFNDVLTQKLDDVCRYPWIGATDDLPQVVLANMAVAVSRQNAAKQVALRPTQSHSVCAYQSKRCCGKREWGSQWSPRLREP